MTVKPVLSKPICVSRQMELAVQRLGDCAQGQAVIEVQNIDQEEDDQRHHILTSSHFNFGILKAFGRVCRFRALLAYGNRTVIRRQRNRRAVAHLAPQAWRVRPSTSFSIGGP